MYIKHMKDRKRMKTTRSTNISFKIKDIKQLYNKNIKQNRKGLKMKQKKRMKIRLGPAKTSNSIRVVQGI